MEQEIIDAIRQLNDAFFKDEGAPIDFMGFEYHTTYYGEVVLFMGLPIWSCDDESRTFNEGTNEYEAYYDCFLREALKIMDDLQIAMNRLKGVE